MKTRDIYRATDMDDDTLTVTEIKNPRDNALPDFLVGVAGEDGHRSVLLSWDQATQLVQAIVEAQNR
ncbi:hypothetical protein ABQF26_03195 [Mycolicibacterium elephantis]